MNYKLFVLIPLILLAFSLIFIFWKLNTTGLSLDIDLKGGNQIIAETDMQVNERELENVLQDYGTNVRTAKNAIYIEFDESIEPDKVIKTLKENGYDFNIVSIQTVGPALGKAFFDQAIVVLLLAFIFMVTTVFLIFRVPLIGFYIGLCPLLDIVDTLAISQILGIKLSLASFAALLMVTGYSVSDDVMTTTRLLNSSPEKAKETLRGSLKTSLTSVFATCVALFSLYVLSISSVITQIASVLLIGLVIDLQNTWLLDVTLLRWSLERKERKKQ